MWEKGAETKKREATRVSQTVGEQLNAKEETKGDHHGCTER